MEKKLNLNWWKWAFLLLLAFNAAFLAVIGSRIIQIREPKSELINQKAAKNIKIGTLTTTKEQLNEAVVSYLKDFQTKKMTYKVYATSSTILFEGTYQLLGYEVPLYIYFQPHRLTNGAIQLQVLSFSVGTLSLPEKDVLQYLKSSYKLPKFVEVLPKQSAIIINLQQLENDANIYLKAQKIDLVKDDIRFDIYKK
ncbi:YpmS family protein [Streptococcus equi]|uniref:YpmS family protein n=1 Tax=Streptococcus equi TaxID=1336 RepID=UPI0013F5D87F|nr:YpmS family protein [Streptococcus equi]MCD3444354.1 YpmS family protein [Streptococcus equi subsp. zooepidemicus]MDI5991092.1 YpmS family protein [Streptococcus equi subsp. zooepidemicus]HEK9998576.1 YpmS family protein [Streptococcus equi subsp. zooepidemicus]HEL0696708.1 YpmS family protein [Streptococcus equi subsp. zooepidemicus]HEL0807644.1 YpmS family protein [Streptococcus equi subsp. zooepidemicus]